MATNTPNYNLVKPGYEDFADINILNGNTDILDATLKSIDDKIDRYGIATGTNTLVLNLVKAPTSLYEGLEIKFKNTTANTSGVTINVNGLGAKPLLKNTGAVIQSGGLKANAFYSAFYDGTNFILQGEGGGALIKSTQRGTTSIPAGNNNVTVTIATVNLAKSILKLTFNSNGNSANQVFVVGFLSSNNTLNFSTNTIPTVNVNVFWEVIEFDDSVNVYSGYASISSSQSEIFVTIPSIQINKSFAFLSYTSNMTSTPYYQGLLGYQLTNSTQLKIQRSGIGTAIDSIRWYVVESI